MHAIFAARRLIDLLSLLSLHISFVRGMEASACDPVLVNYRPCSGGRDDDKNYDKQWIYASIVHWTGTERVIIVIIMGYGEHLFVVRCILSPFKSDPFCCFIRCCVFFLVVVVKIYSHWMKWLFSALAGTTQEKKTADLNIVGFGLYALYVHAQVHVFERQTTLSAWRQWRHIFESGCGVKKIREDDAFPYSFI